MEQITPICKGVLYGFRDSLWGTVGIFTIDSEPQHTPKHGPTKKKMQPAKPTQPTTDEPRILHRVLQSCLLNGCVFMLSILVFDLVFLPLVHGCMLFLLGELGYSLWLWVSALLCTVFSTCWVLPLFFLSKIVNSLWFMDIADIAYRQAHGRPHVIPSVSKFIADILSSLIIQCIYLVQSMLLCWLPLSYIGPLVSQVHLALLYSLYAFEYKWFNESWELHRRLLFIEINWPYFLGFGLPLTVLTSLPETFLMSGCWFSILFPIFIISANEAEPLTRTSDFPLQLFSPSVYTFNTIFRKTITTPKPRK